jgi:membrane protein DedA with SNARE-associated domain
VHSQGLTYTAVLLAVLAEQLYVPIPSVVFLMAAGALSARGEMRTSIVVSLGIVACLAADSIWFWFGRKWGSQAVRLLCRLTADPRKCSRDAHEKFNRYGLSLLCLAKFFPGLGAVLPPLVGAEGVSLARFLALDALGAFLWSGFYRTPFRSTEALIESMVSPHRKCDRDGNSPITFRLTPLCQTSL